jgi:hypothetical protein
MRLEELIEFLLLDYLHVDSIVLIRPQVKYRRRLTELRPGSENFENWPVLGSPIICGGRMKKPLHFRGLVAKAACRT